MNYLDFARSMEKIGVKTLIFTDIATDGMLSGPAFASLEQLQKKVGVRSLPPAACPTTRISEPLHAMGLYGAIIGKAYYAGTIDLAQAVADSGSQAHP